MSIMQFTQTVQIMPPLQMRRSKRTTQPTLPGMEQEPVQAQKVTNRQIAEVLASIADMIESQNGNRYRIQAYRNAARGVLALQESVVDILTRGAPLVIPGLGERLRTRIKDLALHGSMTINNGFYAQTLPQGVRILLTVDHIGLYTAIRLHEELGIDSIEKLYSEAQLHHIRELPGFGVRSEARLQQMAENILRNRQATHNHAPLGGAA
ncbi:histidinol-phosphatase [Ktedonobacteria bacterium brp13]|nr:histidinol-phosphatase [Ktedonobacteria bacterium brp13]